MAEPNRPADDAGTEPDRTAAVAADAPAPTTPHEGADAPTATTPYDAEERDTEPRGAQEPAERPAPVREDAPAEVAEPPASHPHADAPPPAPVAEQPMAAATEDAAQPPRKKGNRLVATAWVLLAAGLFELIFFGANALVALVFGGSAAVVPQLQSVAATSLAWLPVLLFFLLFELTVLLVNRAGRVAYVLASLIVGAIVYVLTVLLFSVIVRHTLGDANTLAQTFLNWEFILVGLVAREVMLWTGLAIGSRGIRVRRRNQEARTRYEREVADVRS